MEHGMGPGWYGNYALQPLNQMAYDQSSSPNKEVRMKSAMDAILKASDMYQLLKIAEEVIEEDWLGKSDDIPGNMYRFAAFGRLFHIEAETEDSSPCGPCGPYVVGLSRICGAGFIWFFQFFGAPALFLSDVFGWGVPAEKALLIEDWEPFNFTDWEELWLTKIIGLVFMQAFVMNGIFVVQDYKQSWEKISQLFRYLDQHTHVTLHGESWLFLDALTNCWVVVWCCLASAVVMGPVTTPHDLLFDGLGLLFLFNLDDIDGDFGFLNQDDWPGDRLAWIHSKMVVPGYKNTSAWSVYDDDEDYEYAHTEIAHWLVLRCYDATIWILWVSAFVLPFIISITSFTLITPEEY